MRSRCVLFLALAFAAVAVVPFRIHPLHAQAAEPVTLTGVVSSAEEGHMEGVLVSAKKTAAGAAVTITVVTDKDGRYRFPVSRLEPAQYGLRVRAAGYDLAAPPGGVTVRLTGKPTTLDLKLQKTKDLAAQLTNADWFDSFPGTDAQKGSIRGCTHCHTMERIVRTNYDADRMVAVIERMSTYPQLSFPLKIQKLPAPRVGPGPQTAEQRSQWHGAAKVG